MEGKKKEGSCLRVQPSLCKVKASRAIYACNGRTTHSWYIRSVSSNDHAEKEQGGMLWWWEGNQCPVPMDLLTIMILYACVGVCHQRTSSHIPSKDSLHYLRNKKYFGSFIYIINTASQGSAKGVLVASIQISENAEILLTAKKVVELVLGMGMCVVLRAWSDVTMLKEAMTR